MTLFCLLLQNVSCDAIYVIFYYGVGCTGDSDVVAITSGECSILPNFFRRYIRPNVGVNIFVWKIFYSIRVYSRE